MEIRLNIVLDISDRMERVLLDIAGRPAGSPRTQETPVTAKEAPQSVQKPQTVDESAEMPFDRETAPEKPQTRAEAEERQPAKCSDENLRAHMDARFRALIGDDWETRVDSDADAKKRQRQITAAFKSIAAQLGAVKPTLLPQSKREEFISGIMNITVGDDGNILIMPF